MTRRDDLEALRDLIANMTHDAGDAEDNAATLDRLIEKAREIGPPVSRPSIVIVGRMEAMFQEYREGPFLQPFGGEIKAGSESVSFRAVRRPGGDAFFEGLSIFDCRVRVTIERIEE